jgi:hypothetical protein
MCNSHVPSDGETDPHISTKEEREEWENADPEDREKEYLPQKYNALRKVPAWGNLVKERFERCMVCGPRNACYLPDD